jgi:glutamate formiminotransferase
VAGKIVECVPNFSEGRDRAKVASVARAIGSAGVAVLRTEMDADHNRSVITFAGSPDAVREAAVRGIGKAAELIDLREHSGVHPRIGAADVVPFVPIEGVTLAECAALAQQTGEEVWRRLRIPVYFYEAAARHPQRQRLENVRREAMAIGVHDPDIGGPEFHASAGAVVIGARKLLIAFNMNLDTEDLDVARKIARTIRASNGGLPNVKALGLPLVSRRMVQVSTNLTDFEVTPPHVVFQAVQREAAALGVRIAASELIGLIPRKAVEMALRDEFRFQHFDGSRILEEQLAAAMPAGELNSLLDRLAAPGTPDGGGSAAAASAAIAAALASKIVRLARLDWSFADHLAFFTAAVRRDAEAFEQLRAAGSSEAALEIAATVPLEVAERAAAMIDVLEEIAPATPSKLASDLETAIALAQAAVRGASATARANLSTMPDGLLHHRLRAVLKQ